MLRKPKWHSEFSPFASDMLPEIFLSFLESLDDRKIPGAEERNRTSDLLITNLSLDTIFFIIYQEFNGAFLRFKISFSPNSHQVK